MRSRGHNITIDKTGKKSRMTFTGLNNILAKIYNIIIYKIYALLYSVQLGIKFIDTFNC